ncbi:hypothetical protein [Azospirillum argentinense]
MTAWLEINGLEAGVAFAAFIALLLGSRLAPILPPGLPSWTDGRRLSALPVAAAALAILTLSASETTQFLTIDEAGIIDRLADAADRGVTIWNMGGLHSTMLIQVPAVRLAQAAGLLPDTVQAVLKAVHWLTGALFLMAAAGAMASLAVTDRTGTPRDRPGPLAAVLLLAGFLLPVSSMALKTLNYDAVSLFGAVAALCLACRMLEEGRPAPAWWQGSEAVVMAALAAQEKLSASPVLLLVCVLVGVAHGLAAPDRPFRRAVLATLGAVTTALLTSLATALLVALAMSGEPALAALAPTLLLGVHEPLVIWILAPLRFLMNIGEALLTVQERLWISGLALLPTLAALVAGAIVGVRLLRDRRAPALGRAVERLSVPAGMAMLLGFGIAGLSTVSPVWAPMEPIPGGATLVGGINGLRLHFGAASHAVHLAESILFAYGVFLAAIPTALLLLALAALARPALRQRLAPRRPAAIHALFGLALVAPLLLALLGTPTFQRYMNIPILLFILTAAVLAFDVWALLLRGTGRPIRIAAVGVLALLVVMEIAPFRPLYAAFRPLALSYPDPDRPRPGHPNFSWTGWGEETMLAGKELARRCAAAPDGRLDGVPCDGLTLRPVYISHWPSSGESGVRTVPSGIADPDSWPDGPSDHYVINRQSVVGGILRAFPPVAPEFEVRYRGFAMAWVFRGDRLRAAGYRFDPYRTVPDPATARMETVDAYGPTVTEAGKPFNPQPDGSSALWLRTSSRLHPGAYALLDDIPLTSTVAGNILSALVPRRLIEAPGRRWLQVIDGEGNMRTDPVPFDIIGGP